MTNPQRPDWLPPEAVLRGLVDSQGITYPYYRARLAEYVCGLLPATGECSIVDIGAGEGLLDELISHFRPDTTVVGVETFIRPSRKTETPIIKIDGSRLPFRDSAFDVSLLINVLHHAANAGELLREALRVARRRVIVKDHVAQTWLQYQKLTMMDVIGNAGTGAVVRGRYLSDMEWRELFAGLAGVTLTEYRGLSFRRGFLLSIFPNELDVIFEVNRQGPD